MEGVAGAQPDTTVYHTQRERHNRKQNRTEDTKAVISGPENSLGGKRPEYAMIPPRKRIKIMEKCKEKGEIKAGR